MLFARMTFFVGFFFVNFVILPFSLSRCVSDLCTERRFVVGTVDGLVRAMVSD